MGNQAEPAGDQDPQGASPGSQDVPADVPERLTIERVIALHHRAVFGYAYRLAGTVADAEDLTQQTFLVAQQKIDQVRSPDKADRWLFAVVRRCFLKSRRRRRPTAAANLDLDLEEVVVAPVGADPLDREAVDRALNELPDPYRLVLAMFYFEELSYKQIAQELEVPVGTVMSRLARAKQRLRQILTPPDPVRRRE